MVISDFKEKEGKLLGSFWKAEYQRKTGQGKSISGI
jgi:hypothetical protein